MAKAEKLKPLEVELKRLEDLSESIVNDFSYMRSREEGMRDTNGNFERLFWNSSECFCLRFRINPLTCPLFQHFFHGVFVGASFLASALSTTVLQS